MTASTVLGRISIRFSSVFMGVFDHSSRSVFVRSGTDVGREGLVYSLSSNSSQLCSIGLRSGLSVGQSSSSTPSSLIHVFMDIVLCTGSYIFTALESSGCVFYTTASHSLPCTW